MNKSWGLLLSFAIALLFVTAAPIVVAQTTTTGELGGTVTDPTGAVVPSVQLTLKNVANGGTITTKSNASGFFKFSLLNPGSYTLTASATGFQSLEQNYQVAVGASVTASLRLALSSGHEVVEVSAGAAALDTEDANLNTNFSEKQVELLPNPGNDLSAVALTSPGAVMNTAGGAMFGGGNFEVYGLPATSNLFTVDGSNYNDPYFNVNNSGATNLTLGLNDVEESTVVTNGYSGSYGGLAGANINYVTRAGGNAFHGNATWWWNGSYLNANNYFRDQHNGLAGKNVNPTPFVNANQWAGSIGGPIKKDKAFFFFDYEGIRLAIPSPTQINLPTPAFQQAIINNLNDPAGANLPNSVGFYNHLFSLYNNVSQAGASALPPGTDPASTAATGPGCSDISPSTQSDFAAFAAAPCAVQVAAGFSAKTHDVFYAGRVDLNLSNNDRLFVRTEHEHGLQATYTDPVSPVFNAQSDQPQWQANVQETHSFGGATVNTFNTSLLWYSAGFALSNPKAAVSPTTGLAGVGTIELLDGSMASLGGLNFIFPQGRNITQYQFVDDFSWVHGRHNFKVGANFRRNDISDQNFTIINPLILEFSLSQFANGGGASFDLQNFPTRTEVPIALYQLGIYGADDIRVNNKLKLTLSLRLDHLSNPICQINCFQRFVSPFQQLNHTGPVNSAIAANQHQAFPSVTTIAAQPKIGFAYQLSHKTVLRGGIGIFADALPTGAIDTFLQQAPLDLGFAQVVVGPINPAEPGSVNATLASQAAGFKTNYAAGGLGCAVPGANPATCVPAFSFADANKAVVPRYYEWSLEVQQDLGHRTTLDVMYVGNHGSHEEWSNAGVNAFCCASGQLPSGAATFGDLPAAPTDPRFGVVQTVSNIANSNYAGLVLSLKHSAGGGFTFQGNYTYSHALDEISNNSLSPFGLNTGGVSADIIFPESPFNIRKYNYGNADYDIRQNFTMNYVWADAFRHLTSRGPNVLLKGWSFSGTIFRHSGLPMTIYDNTYTSALSGTNYGSGTQYIFANISGSPNSDCSGSAAEVTVNGSAAHPCWSASNFPDPTTTYGVQRRNQFHGPGYFNTDFAVEKAFGITKREGTQFSIGARFFNVLNHPDFYFPIMNSNNPQLGQIVQTVSSPTSIFGSGLGADASPRLIQLQAKFVF